MGDIDQGLAPGINQQGWGKSHTQKRQESHTLLGCPVSLLGTYWWRQSPHISRNAEVGAKKDNRVFMEGPRPGMTRWCKARTSASEQILGRSFFEGSMHGLVRS